MHPCGKYRFNTLSIILAKEYGYPNLRSIKFNFLNFVTNH
jgi:hypothetical protein